jgi:hypothetical protein
MGAFYRFLLLFTMVTLFGALSARAQAEARIIEVRATTDVVVVKSTFQDPDGRRLPKFAPEGRRLQQAVLWVDWQTVRALPAGALVKFSYRRPGSDEVRTLEQSYPRALTGLQHTRFAVTLEEAARDRVVAWSVQILQRDQVLAEQHSAAWR